MRGPESFLSLIHSKLDDESRSGLNFEIIYQIFVKSPRETKFELYNDGLNELTLYTAKTTEYLRDLDQLYTRHPVLHQTFVEGFSGASRTSGRFSAMGLD